ncbi:MULTISPECIES: flotillin family protein [unclassified Coleofasciculus]|uniref:flotillin family protein n=1 Tax=unclassified Coleofasciculus TaxID=2692782 RepID=UPI00187FEF58|nr:MULTISPECIES: SPFH domain-containing protein [unclassified Coleofasciculus]MBE9128645.1 flotillin family protein [Coleofasciculus sp. LEGE 07081]MBE9147249.1 flotillin family protein [Coleofasciculus sp. LEGE 07092]
MEIIAALLGILGLGTGAGLLVIRNLYYICQPSEVLIFAGSHNRTSEGQTVGYRLVKGGSSVRLPLLERAFRMDLTNMIIELRVSNAYSKGGIPLTVEGVANIKIAGEEPTIHNAIERLLGKNRKEIEQFAKETLEGNLRGVLASLTPEQVNEDKIAFVRSLLEEAEDDLEKLGLVLDNLQIQNISDNVRYLDSIGRKQRADLLRDARIAEAQAQAESVIQTAENDKITALRRLERDIEIARAEAERRVKDALTKRGALVAEVEAEIASEVVRTQAEVGVQRERIKQVEQQLQADVVAPAEAECKGAISMAKGNAARIIEDGKAQVQGTRSLAESWKAAGPNAREIFLFQKLDVLLQTMVSTVPEVEVQNVTVIDAKNGNSATKMASFLEQLRQGAGIDVAGAVRQLTGSEPPGETPLLEKSQLDRIWNRLEADIQNYLDRIAQTHPSEQQAEKAVEQVIKRNPKLKQRLRKVLDAQGQGALQVLFAHPLIYVPTDKVETWVMED